MLDALQHLTGSVSSRMGEVLLLVLLPFFREDVAILTGGLLVVERGVPYFAPGEASFEHWAEQVVALWQRTEQPAGN